MNDKRKKLQKVRIIFPPATGIKKCGIFQENKLSPFHEHLIRLRNDKKCVNRYITKINLSDL